MINPCHRLMAAAITPCPQKGTVDLAAMSRLCCHLAASGCTGLFVPSSTGEAALLDDTMRRRLVRAAREGCPSSTGIWSGVSGLGAAHSIELSKAAAEEGADGVIVMAPFFYKLSQEELKDYCLRIAEGSPVPIGIYHHLRMPTAFEPETIGELAAHPNIQLFKDTSGDLERMKQIVEVTAGSSLRLYQGSETLLLASLEAGATGSITALANVVPELHHQILDDFLEGRIEQARAGQAVLDQFWRIFRRPELSGSFSLWLRTVTLPLCWRGVFEDLACMMSESQSFREFDLWLKNHYEENGLMDVLFRKDAQIPVVAAEV